MDGLLIHASKIQESYLNQNDKIGGINANFSKHFKLKKIGVHFFEIPCGFRTSKPHAESDEEEFIYIIEGEIDLWFNGQIKPMKAGDSIGFPSGTGIGHCFINNSKKSVKLFVAGERTKASNKYRFHLEPHLAQTCGDKWWGDMPEQVLGAHNGMPGLYSDELINDEIIVFNHGGNFPEASFSYPNDSETFGHGICLSRKFNLNKIAVWLEKLPSGKRSSWPHAHSIEEEFIYVLDGKADVWLDHQLYPISAHEAIDFKAGSGIAHTIVNQSGEDFYYLCVGECELNNDKIFYPLHPKRNEEMKNKGHLWESCPIK